MTIEEKIEIMKAFAEGELVESKPKKDTEWKIAIDPSFNWEEFDYRIRTENSDYRPFKSAEECLQEMQKHNPVGWLFDTINHGFEFFDSIDDDGIYKINVIDYTFDRVFKVFTFVDGTPFGIKIS